MNNAGYSHTLISYSEHSERILSKLAGSKTKFSLSKAEEKRALARFSVALYTIL